MSTTNTQVIKDWVTALESGEYEQTQGVLRYTRRDGGYEFCCLGVLCDLAVKAGVIGEPTELGRYGDEGYGSVGELPAEVRDWAGLDSSDPTVDTEEFDILTDRYDVDNDEWTYGKVDASSLAGLNDNHGQTFAQIAQILRKNYLNTDGD
jgi:hypothetical protein